MKRTLFLPAIVISMALVWGCSDNIVSECSTDGVQVGVVQKVTFSEIQRQILTPSCAIVSCHAGSNPPEGLILSEGSAYSNLVNQPSNQRPGLQRVTPGNSSQSYLIHKLRGQNTSVMPPAGKLARSLVDSVAAWIDRGAANN